MTDSEIVSGPESKVAARAAVVKQCRDATDAYLRGDIPRFELRQARGLAYDVYADCSAECNAHGAKEAFDAVERADDALTGATS